MNESRFPFWISEETLEPIPHYRCIETLGSRSCRIISSQPLPVERGCLPARPGQSGPRQEGLRGQTIWKNPRHPPCKIPSHPPATWPHSRKKLSVLCRESRRARPNHRRERRFYSRPLRANKMQEWCDGHRDQNRLPQLWFRSHRLHKHCPPVRFPGWFHGSSRTPANAQNNDTKLFHHNPSSALRER